MAARSLFVTALGWIVALFCGGMALSSGYMALLLGSDSGAKLVAEFLAEVPPEVVRANPLPFAVLKHARTVAIVALNLSVLMGFVAAALIRRAPWARGAAIAILIAGMACQAGALLWEATHLTATTTLAERVVRMLYPLVTAVIQGWLVVKLQSPAIRVEFESEAPSAIIPPPTAS